ncbi:MAG: phenylacetate--CoA ligase, partial [Deltaproteobacteria bacterium]|nr:phenylacetate--CoA ligase [Deltaproteobacteria bacterium]
MKITPLDKWIADKINISGLLDLERLRKYQLDKLLETLVAVKKSSRFYRSLFSKVDPSDIRDIADIAYLPFTGPDDIASDPESFICVPKREIGRIVTLGSSGTT